MATFKITFTLDDDDARYFRSLYRRVKRNARERDSEEIIREARTIVKRVRANRKTPRFVLHAIDVLADLADLMRDEEWAAPKKVRDAVLAALGYFAMPDDLIPDHVPGLGFLDDAFMIKFIEDEFRDELWGYRKFCRLRDSSEQRPWSPPARQRLAARLERDRKLIRRQIELRAAKRAAKKETSSYAGW